MSGEKIGSLTVIVVRVGVGGQEQSFSPGVLGVGRRARFTVHGQGVGGGHGFSLELSW